MYDDVIYHGRFIWNRLKAEANHRKHGITFEKATEVFDDPFFIEEYDEESSQNEDRYNIVGFVKGIYMTVSFTLRDNLTRFFSARKADGVKFVYFNILFLERRVKIKEALLLFFS